MEKDRILLFIPAYNCEKYIGQAVDSVIGQSYPYWELLILDDCSTDESREILMEYAVRYPNKTIVDFNKTRSGEVFTQWDKGIRHAKGSLIWIAKSEDWCEPNFLEKMVPWTWCPGSWALHPELFNVPQKIRHVLQPYFKLGFF